MQAHSGGKRLAAERADEPRRVDGRPVAVEDATPEGGRGAVARELLARKRDRLFLDAELARYGDRALEDRVLPLRRRHAQQPTLAKPDVVLEGADGRNRPVRRARDRESSLRAEHVAKAREARPVTVEKPAVPPARPDPATRRLEHDHVEGRITSLQLECRPEPRETAADDRDVGGRVTVERGLLGIGRRLLEPPWLRVPRGYGRRWSSSHASASVSPSTSTMRSNSA